jgi:ribosomal protein S18 acetylase RimI-like enzyme
MTGPALTFEPLDAEAIGPWLEGSRRDYIAERMEAGDSRAEAEANADGSLGRLMPGGTPAPGQLVGRLLLAGQPVGRLWIGPAGADRARWWVFEVLIDTGHRRQGLGRQAMVVAEGLARAQEATTLGLSVFAHNQVARRLYRSLGYDESSVQMRKSL